MNVKITRESDNWLFIELPNEQWMNVMKTIDNKWEIYNTSLLDSNIFAGDNRFDDLRELLDHVFIATI